MNPIKININHDALIDDVARDMTAGEPAGDFRARVMAALPPASNRWWLRAVIPAGAIAGLVAAWVVVNPAASPDSSGSAGSPGPVSSVAQAVNRGEAVGLVDPTPGLKTRRSMEEARRSMETAVSSEELAWHARAVAPLPALTQLTIPPIQPIPLSIAPITVDPIVSDPITLAAIDSRSGERD